MTNCRPAHDRFAEIVGRSAGIFAIAVGVIVLVGWMLGLPQLTSIFPDFVTMKANTAIGFVLLGSALLALQISETFGRWPRLLCGGLVVVLGFLTLVQYVADVNLGIDQLLFQEAGEVAGTSHPGRMSPITALNFLVLGFGLVILPRATRSAQWLSLTGLLVALFAIAGYMCGVQPMYGSAFLTEMALHTAITFLMVSLGMLMLRPHTGPLAVVMADSVGGMMARRLLPLIVGVLFLLGGLTIVGEAAFFFDLRFGLALLIVASIVVAATIVWANASWLHGLETRRQVAERAQGRLAALVDSSGDAILGLAFDGHVTDWNAGAERLFGYAAAEVVGKSILDTIVPPDRKQEVIRNLRQIQEGRRVEPFETVRQTKDGKLIPISIRISPIRDAAGQVIGASAIDRDISKRRAAERRRNARSSVTQILAHQQSIEKALDEILATVCSALEWDAGCFWRLQADSKTLLAARFWSQPERKLNEFRDTTMQLSLHQGSCLPGRVWQTGQPIWISEVSSDLQFVRAPQSQQVGFHGGCGCPVRAGDKFLGVIEFFSQELRQPDDHLMETIATIGGQIGQFIQRQEVEQSLQKSEERLRLALEAGNLGTWEWHIPSGKVIWSSTLERIHGLPTGGFAGTVEAFQQDIHPDDQQRVREVVRRTVDEGQEHHLEYRIVWPDGTVKWVEARGKLFCDELDRPVRLMGVSADVTRRRQIEQSLRFLAEASRSLSFLIDYRSTLGKITALAVPDIADMCAVELLEADDSLQQLAVSHLEPAKVQLAEELNRRYPPDPLAPQGAMRVIRTGEPELESDISESMLREMAQDEDHFHMLRELGLKSSVRVPLRIHGKTAGVLTCLTAESGRQYGPNDLAMMEDLAHRAAIAIENAHLYQEVREAGRRKDEFLAMLAHELRNPLAPICHGLEILKMESDGQNETINLMQQQVEHLSRLVDDLLDVSRIMRGKIELRKESIQIASVVERSLEVMRPVCESRRQQLSVSLPQEEAWLRADPVRLTQVLENLLHNASKYSDPGGWIDLSASSEGEQIVLRVRDNGAGIEPDLLPHVFELFAQSTRTLDRSQGGLGIGLTLVQRLVELHGGSVMARSAGTGQGSEFVVRLPRGAPSSTIASADARKSPSESRRILAVDDNVGAAKMLAMLLTKVGPHSVEIVHDGETALQRIEAFQPEMVFLDIGLPRMDGYQVAEKIRSRSDCDGILLVALTGYGQADDLRKSSEAGFDEHLVKPPALTDIEKLFSHPKLTVAHTETFVRAGTTVAQQHASAPAQPECSAPAAERDMNSNLDPADKDAWRELVHEVGNQANVAGLAAAILERSSDASDLATVAKLIKGLETSLNELVTTLREQQRRADNAGNSHSGSF